MRGKLVHWRPQRDSKRITPARAGKTMTEGNRALAAEDHPRACGENSAADVVNQCDGGSPPRVRGKHDEAVDAVAESRITPARAGKTASNGRRWRCAWDHPRACGENQLKQSLSHTLMGSPPRVRGKPPLAPQPAQPSRITPARAGKTSRPASSSSVSRDHPRACGENKPRHHASPRPLRITPARAGKTQTRRYRGLSATDHPRACGENCGGRVRAATCVGSPPRVRGKPIPGLRHEEA